MDKSLILNQIKRAHNIGSNAEFARILGISPQNLSNWYKRGTYDANLILRKFTNVNEVWLLTGEGEMLKSESTFDENSTPAKMIPFYDAQVVAGNSYEMEMSAYSRPSKMIRMGDFLNDSEAAIQVFGNSMTPNYPAGCIVGTKLHTDSFIEPGTVYVIETRDNRYLKRLYYSEGEDCFECVSDNHMLCEEGSRKGKPYYPAFKIPINEVVRLHRVTGVIKRNIL